MRGARHTSGEKTHIPPPSPKAFLAPLPPPAPPPDQETNTAPSPPSSEKKEAVALVEEAAPLAPEPAPEVSAPEKVPEVLIELPAPAEEGKTSEALSSSPKESEPPLFKAFAQAAKKTPPHHDSVVFNIP